jgi:nucleoside-diphosphate-sugar epimerase
MNVLMLGCGDIGTMLGRQLLARGDRVTGMRRRVESLPEGFSRLALDVVDSEACQLLRALAYDAVVITLTPGAFTDEAYRRTYIDSLGNLLPIWRQQSNAPYIYFVSSTSVYGQSEGEWVDEDSVTTPGSFSGRYLLAAEQLLAESGLSYCIVRFSGIYGPGRNHLLERVRAGKGSAAALRQWSNRIHRDDCVGLLAHLLGLQEQGRPLQACYVGSDDCPTRQADIEQWLAQALGVTLNEISASQRRGGNKRCDNTRMKASGYQLHYPCYKSGYGALLSESEN